MKCIFLLIGLNFLLFPAFGQEVYYEMSNGKIINNEQYSTLKSKLSERGELEETLIKTETRNDSIIKTINLTVTRIMSDKKVSFDPYSKFKTKIGSHFPIENFNNSENSNYSSNELEGKPTLINFWFTKCPPCIREIPYLNEIKDSFGENVNFIAITFDTKEQIEKFNNEAPFNFNHITNSKEALDKLGVQAYPMNILLDKNGNIVQVYGEISYNKDEIIELLKKLL